MRQPVIEYAFDTPFIVTVREYKSGQTFRMFANFEPSSRMCSYISSLATTIFGCLRNTSPSAFSSFAVYVAPVGFEGLLIQMRRDLGVMAASSCFAVILKPVSIVV